MIITLHNRGTVQHPRFVLMNPYGWVYSEADQAFVENESGGTLYHAVQPAMARMRELLLADCAGQPVRKFRAPVYLELYTPEHVPQDMIEEWCVKATRFVLHADQFGLGPVNSSLGLVSVDWGQMEEITPPD